MNCDGFRHWLDRGADAAEVEGEAASVHAAGCPRCASTLRDMCRIEIVLRIPLAAPRGLAERTLAAIATGVRGPAGGRPSTRAQALIEAAAPVAVLACLAATIVALGTGSETLVRDPASPAGIMAGVVPAIAWAAWQLFHWPTSLVERA